MCKKPKNQQFIIKLQPPECIITTDKIEIKSYDTPAKVNNLLFYDKYLTDDEIVFIDDVTIKRMP